MQDYLNIYFIIFILLFNTVYFKKHTRRRVPIAGVGLHTHVCVCVCVYVIFTVYLNISPSIF